jgi:hypothetical protein
MIIQPKINFKSHGLKVDFITFSFVALNYEQFALSFHKAYGFNCFLSEGPSRKIVEALYQDKSTKDTLIIRLNYYQKTVIEFPGKSGQKFHKLAQLEQIDFEWFDLATLTRFDICYDSKKPTYCSDSLVDKFLVTCRQKILNSRKKRTLKLINNSAGVFLSVNLCSNPRYFRIYDKHKEGYIRFELEFKREAIAPIQKHFFNSELELFEYKLTQIYFKYIPKMVCLEHEFANWLITVSRKEYLKESPSNLSVEYFVEGNLLKTDNNRFLHFLQFLNFLKTLEPEAQECGVHFLERKRYCIQNFNLTDFTKFIGLEKIEQKQRNLIIHYFKILQESKPLVKEFADGSFQTYATVLYTSVTKKSNRWSIRTYVMEDLYRYQYPFSFSNYFLSSANKANPALKTAIIRCISVRSIKKEFPFFDFIEQMKPSNSNQNLRKIKQEWIFLIKIIIKDNLIETKIQIVYKNEKIEDLDLAELDLKRLKKAKLIIFYENLEKYNN